MTADASLPSGRQLRIHVDHVYGSDQGLPTSRSLGFDDGRLLMLRKRNKTRRCQGPGRSAMRKVGIIATNAIVEGADLTAKPNVS